MFLSKLTSFSKFSAAFVKIKKCFVEHILRNCRNKTKAIKTNWFVFVDKEQSITPKFEIKAKKKKQ